MSALAVVSDLLKSNRTSMLAALPRGLSLTIDRLERTALTQVSKNPAIAACDPYSIARAVLDAAHMGLEFGELKQCALVPYNNSKTGKKDAKLMVQWQGWLALLWRSGSIKQVQCKAVYQGDLFEVEYGSETRIIHRPAFKTKIPELYYAAAVLPNDEIMIEVMTEDQVKDHAKQYAKGLDKNDSPWNTAFEEMAKKTVLRKLIKLLPLQADSTVRKAAEIDDKIWEADKEAIRMQKYHELHEAPEVVTEADKAAATKFYEEACGKAKKQKVDIADLTKDLDKTDVKRLHAVTDSILFRCESIEASSGESTYE